MRLNRAQKEWEDLYRSIDNSLPNQILNQEQLQEELDSVSTSLSEAKKELKKIAEENERITRANTTYRNHTSPDRWVYRKT